MQKRFLPIVSLATALILIGYSCTKIDTTTQGADLVTIDNINTRADTLDVETQQGFFANQPYSNNGDSTALLKTANHILGKISKINDPLFGGTDASIFVQFKPSFFPFYFGNAGDTTRNGTFGNASPAARLDSVVLCLSYKGSWGDTANSLLHVKVLKIDDVAFANKTDTIRPVGVNPLITASSVVLGEADITMQTIAANTYIGRNGAGLPSDSVTNQIRIKINPTYAAILYNQDSSSAAANNAFSSDANFRAIYKGFEIKVSSTNGKVLHFVNLSEVKSRLEFHYKKAGTTSRDTIMQPFLMYAAATIDSTRYASSTANYIQRDYTGATANSNTGSNTKYVYLQTSPGTYGKLKVKGIDTLSNRIVHRAYLIVDQDPATTVETDPYGPPAYMYVDLKDTLNTTPQVYKPVYFDLTNSVSYNPDATLATDVYFPFSSNVNINTFGGAAEKRYDAGNLFYRYEINLTRYVQHIVTNKYKNYDLRLYPPYSFIYPQYVGTNYFINYYNPIALGRIRVGGGNWPRTYLHKMRMVIISSAVK